MMVLMILLIHLVLVFNRLSANETNILEITHKLNFDNVIKSASLRVTSNSTCASHIEEIKTNLLDFKNAELWALTMFDASTKIPESVLMGLTTHLGNFDECIGVQNVNTPTGMFNGQHCLASVNIIGLTSNAARKSFPSSSRHLNSDRKLRVEQKSRTGGSTSTSVTSLTLSYCIPSSCSPSEFEQMVNSTLAGFPIDVKVFVPEGMCQTAQKRDLATEDWVVIGILIFLAVLAVSSTMYDMLKTGPKNDILCAFSWYTNGKKLLSTKTSGDTLQALHGIRFLSMCWVVMGHRHQMSITAPSINFTILGEYMEDIWRMYATNATLSVDTFLLLSGLLVSYVFLKTMGNRRSFNIPLYYLHRYLRLTPPYAVMMLLQASLLRYVSSGPLFRSTLDTLATNCHKYWWASLVYINNYYEPVSSCLPQGWYLAVDMQLFILSPLILYPLWKWPRRWSMSLLSALILAGLAIAFTVSYVEEIPASMFTKNTDFVLLQYYPTHTRFTPWLIGVCCGYFFHEAKQKEFKISKRLVFLGWCVGIVSLLGALLGLNPFNKQEMEIMTYGAPVHKISNFQASIYTALSRSLWATGVGWIAFACVFGYGGPVNTFLSWKVFQPLSRLTYCVYLVHASYQVIRTMSAKTPIYISDLNTLPDFISDLVVCLLFGTVLSLGIESPTIILEKHLLKGNTKKSQQLTVSHKNEKSESTVEDCNSTPDLEEVKAERGDKKEDIDSVLQKMKT